MSWSIPQRRAGPFAAFAIAAPTVTLPSPAAGIVRRDGATGNGATGAGGITAAAGASSTMSDGSSDTGRPLIGCRRRVRRAVGGFETAALRVVVRRVCFRAAGRRAGRRVLAGARAEFLLRCIWNRLLDLIRHATPTSGRNV